MRNKKIFIYSTKPEIHNLYSVMKENPPEGYELILPKIKKSKTYIFLSKNKLVKLIYRKLKRVGKNPIISEALATKAQKFPENIDLVFSPAKLFLGEHPPYIIEIVDKPTALAGNDYKLFKKNKKFIKKQLESENCKKILCWTKACKQNFIEEFQSDKINKKLDVVYLSKPIPKINFIKKYNGEKINLLFVGSINNPDDFLIKGGLETLETFRIISKKYPNLNLYVKCKIPTKIKKKYENLDNLHIIEEMISNEDLEILYKNADIFMTPSHNLNAFAPIEAMQYKLPLIGINTWAVDEVIRDNVNGFLIKKSDKINYKKEKINMDVRNPKFLKQIQQIDHELIKRIAEKTELLIKDPKLRKKFGENGRKMIEDGKFSFKIRQKKLKNIFDEILKN